METLDSVLRSYVLGRPTMGPRSDAGRREQRDALARTLATIARTNRLYFNICFGAVVLLFVLACAIVLIFLQSPKQISAVFGAVGITVTGLLSRMTTMWKQKVKADTLLALLPIADDEQIKKVIDELLKT